MDSDSGLILCPGTLPNSKPCRRVLGRRLLDRIEIRHQRRVIVASLPVSIRCEDCHRVWRQNDVPAAPAVTPWTIAHAPRG